FPMSRSGSTFATPISGSRELEVSWAMRASEAQAEYEASVVRFVSIHSTRLEYRYRIACKVRQGRVSLLDVDVPRGAFVRTVADGVAYQWNESSSASRQPRLRILFSEPREQDFAVDFSLILPLESADGEIRVPLVDAFGSEAEQRPAKVVLNDVGVSTGSEYRLIPISHESDRITSLSADSALKKESLAIGLRDPELAYRLTGSTDLVVRLAPLTPLRKINTQTQHGTIGQNRLDWKFTAEMRTENAPAFGHRLTVDQRLKIDSISVQEDGAERRVRWARDGEHVNVFLRDRTTATQDLVLFGSMPLSFASETRLPIVRVDEATVAQSQLTLSRDPRIAVELDNIAGLVPTDSDANAPRPGNSVLVGRYLLSSENDLPTIRLVPRNERARADTATLLVWTSSRSAILTTLFRIHGSDRPTRPLRLRVPSSIGAHYQLHAPHASTRTENREDGSVEITLEPLTPSNETVTVSVVSTVTPPSDAGTNWILPRVTAADVSDGDNYLAIATSQPARPANNAATTIVNAELPTWIAASGSLTGQHEWTAYVLKGPAQSQDWTIARTPTTLPAGRMRTALVRTYVEMTTAGEQEGVTEALVIDAGGRSIDLSIPEQFRLRAVFVNGRSVSAPTTNPLAIPLENGPRPQTVVLYWSRTIDALSQFSAISAVSPQPVPAAESSVFVFSAPPNRRLFVRSEGFSSHESELAAITAEGLLQAFRENANDENTVAALWPSLVGLREDFRRWLDVNSADSASGLSMSEARTRQRLESVVSRIDDLVPVVARSTSPATGRGVPANYFAGSFRIEPIPENRDVLLGRPPAEGDPASSSVWQIDLQLFRLGIGGIVFLALALIGWKLSNRFHAPYRRLWVLIGWGALGIVWWLLMIPSIVGAVILAAAIIGFATRRHQQIPDQGSQHESFALNA
ncbi:MAG: hypothetical protein AB7O26_11035, partial [Planctomycetaceae bacterium]